METKETVAIETLEAQVQRLKEALGKANSEAQTLLVRVLEQDKQVKALKASTRHFLAAHGTLDWTDPDLYRECKNAMGEPVG